MLITYFNFLSLFLLQGRCEIIPQLDILPLHVLQIILLYLSIHQIPLKKWLPAKNPLNLIKTPTFLQIDEVHSLQMVRRQCFIARLHVNAVGVHVTKIPITLVIETDIAFNRWSGRIFMLGYFTHIGSGNVGDDFRILNDGTLKKIGGPC